MDNRVHLIKLSVGTDSVEDLARWQARRRSESGDGRCRHVTRMWPRREADVLRGGSIYWVIKGLVQCRQPIVGFEEVIRGDGIRRCALVLGPDLIRVAPAPRRAFQGWRYLDPADAPPDLPSHRADEEALPADLTRALAEIGVL